MHHDSEDRPAHPHGREIDSVERTIRFLRVELQTLDPEIPAAQLYDALLTALKTVYPDAPSAL